MGESRKFISIGSEEEEKKGEGWLLAQYEFASEKDLVIWVPDAYAFEQAVKDGKLKGNVETSTASLHVALTSQSEEILRLIDAKTDLRLFLYESPLVFKKVDRGKQLGEDVAGEQQ